jgi:acetyl esterase
MALDEATAAFLARAAAAEQTPLHELTVAEARQRRSGSAESKGPEMSQVTNARIPSAGGSIPIRVLVPNERPRAVVVFYHGGGWVLGGLDESDALARQLASRTGCAVVSVGSRLAPEYRYPTAVEDAWSGVRWVGDRVEEVAGARVPLIVAGEGAGGNLAAVVARRSFERKGPAIALQVLICPVTDSDFDGLSYTDPANQLLLDRAGMIWFWDHYAPDIAARRHPDASPLETVFLTGVPPAVILTAEHDVLRDDGELYAMRLVQAGVAVEHRRFAGQMHGFCGMIDVLPGSAKGLSYVAEGIDRCLERVPGAAT